MPKVTLDAETAEALRSSGIGAVGVSYSFMGLPLSDIVTILTGVYIFINLILIAPKFIRTILGKRK